MKEYMNSHPIPTEQALKHWAESGDYRQLVQALSALGSSAAEQSRDVQGNVETAGLQCELAAVFGGAREQLAKLAAANPQGAEVQLASTEALLEAARQLETGIRDYLEALHERTDTALHPPVAADSLKELAGMLADEARRATALKNLSRLGRVSRDWTVEQAGITSDSVTEYLWEVAASGRDFSDAISHGTEVGATRQGLTSEWLSDITEGFTKADAELGRAVAWLSNEAEAA